MAQKFEKWYCSWSKMNDFEFKWVLKKAKSEPSGVFETQNQAYDYFVNLNINGYLWYHQDGKYVRVVKSIKSLQNEKVIIVDSNDDEDKNREQERLFEELKKQNEEFMKKQQQEQDDILLKLQQELEDLKKTDDLQSQEKLLQAQKAQQLSEQKADKAQDEIDFLKSQLEDIYNKEQEQKQAQTTQELSLLKQELDTLKNQSINQNRKPLSDLEFEIAQIKNTNNNQGLVSQQETNEINMLKNQVDFLTKQNINMENYQNDLEEQIQELDFSNFKQPVHNQQATQLVQVDNERLTRYEDHILKTQEILIKALSETSKKHNVLDLGNTQTIQNSTHTVEKVIKTGKLSIFWILFLVFILLLILGFMVYVTVAFMGYAPWFW